MIINTKKLYQPQDAVKLAFQAAFGAEHMLVDMAKARAMFYEEYAKDLKVAPLVEEIASDVVRVNLAAWKEANLPAEWLFDLFVMPLQLDGMPSNIQQSSRDKLRAHESFISHINEIEKLAESSLLPFSYADWKAYVRAYDITNPTPVRHSEEYRRKERPAYRIVSGFFTRLIPVLFALRGRQSAVIGIDGKAASGKSTMAAGLARIFRAEPISMDDFFLPGELRATARLGEPGGNVHYERFAEEVIPNLRSKKVFCYRPFNCKTMDFDLPKKITPSPFMVVEGAYCHHPYFGGYLDTKVFSDITPEVQAMRLIKRNGEAIAEVFRNKWIPMEELYFGTYGIKENACLIV